MSSSDPLRTFTVWQVVGGLAWSLGLTLAGYALGSSVPNVDRYLLPMVAVIVALSLIPLAAEVYRSRRDGKAKEATPMVRSGCRAATGDAAAASGAAEVWGTAEVWGAGEGCPGSGQGGWSAGLRREDGTKGRCARLGRVMTDDRDGLRYGQGGGW